jgi:pyrroloquinoline quinone (PQQ) biosynthesis protein C
MTSRERAYDWFDTVYGYDENHGEISRKTLCQMLEEHEAFVRAEEREACIEALRPDYPDAVRMLVIRRGAK